MMSVCDKLMALKCHFRYFIFAILGTMTIIQCSNIGRIRETCLVLFTDNDSILNHAYLLGLLTIKVEIYL